MQLMQLDKRQRRHHRVIQRIVGIAQRQAEIIHQGGKAQVDAWVVLALMRRQLLELVVVVQAGDFDLGLRQTLAERRKQGAVEHSHVEPQVNKNGLDLSFDPVVDTEQAKLLRILNVYADSFAMVCSAKHVLPKRRHVSWEMLPQYRATEPSLGWAKDARCGAASATVRSGLEGLL